MMRVALGVQYDGAGFRGWQAQPTGVRTVQSTLEQALSKVADHPIKLVCAGRTDTGVHGVAQVAHFDTHAARSARSWVLGGNAHLPPDVSLNWACEAPDEMCIRDRWSNERNFPTTFRYVAAPHAFARRFDYGLSQRRLI